MAHHFPIPSQTIKAHLLPLTNMRLNKAGSRIITGSYDRTCKVWDAESGEELQTLEGHKNVVYVVACNLPFGDKIATGSFDKTARVGRCWNVKPRSAPHFAPFRILCKIWSMETGQCCHVLKGHNGEIVRTGET